MDPVVIGIIGVIIFTVLVILGVWVGFAAATVGLVGIAVFKGWGTASGVAGFLPYTVTASFEFSVIPMFIIMGYFAHYGGVTRNLFNAGRRWFGHLPGGLAVATTFACAGFGACSGSSTAAAAVMAKVAIPEMQRYNYDSKLAAGCVASAGTLAVMIPPSTVMVIYGVVTEQSIGRLLIGGIIPGIVAAILISITVYIWCKVRPGAGAPMPRATWKERFASLKGIWAVLLLALSVIGGIYSGIFTPTEAGGIAAFVALVIAVATRQLSWSNFKQSLLDTGKATAMIFITLMGILVFLRFLALSGTIKFFVDGMMSLPLSPLGVMIIIIIIYFILGMFVSATGMMLLTLPAVFPVVLKLGYDPIWFGILVTALCEIAFVTPPVAMNLYAVKASAPEIPTMDITKGIMPFLITFSVFLVLLIAFPQLATWLPATMKK